MCFLGLLCSDRCQEPMLRPAPASMLAHRAAGHRWTVCKPSAQPTLVRTQHLPLPAKTTRGLGFLRVRGPSGAVSPCVIVGQETSLHHDGYGHIADGFGPGASGSPNRLLRDFDGSADSQCGGSLARKPPVIPTDLAHAEPTRPGIGAVPVLATGIGPGLHPDRVAGATEVVPRDTPPKADHAGPGSAGPRWL
jgi:hypothetical protein